MKSSTLFVGAMAGVLAFSCVAAEQARAVTVYTYTGNNFPLSNILDGSFPSGTYTPSMNVTGSFTLQNALAANLPGGTFVTTPELISFSFFDGRNSITNLNATSSSFIIGTNGLGNINSWAISLKRADATYPNVILSLSESIATQTALDTVSVVQCTGLAPDGGGCFIGVDQAFVLQAPGSWSSVTTPNAVPLPAALPLFATGLGALALLGWRRRRKLAA